MFNPFLKLLNVSLFQFFISVVCSPNFYLHFYHNFVLQTFLLFYPFTFVLSFFHPHIWVSVSVQIFLFLNTPFTFPHFFSFKPFFSKLPFFFSFCTHIHHTLLYLIFSYLYSPNSLSLSLPSLRLLRTGYHNKIGPELRDPLDEMGWKLRQGRG